MATKVADSDVLIDYLKGVDPGATAVERGLRNDELAMTAVNEFEVLCGITSPATMSSARRFLASIPTLPLDGAAAGVAADIDRQLRAPGLRLATADTLIAGIALANGLSLLTRNIRHFDRIDGLVIETV